MLAKHCAIILVFSAFNAILCQTFSATYCGTLYQPFCPSGCNFYSLDYVDCSSNCGDVVINAPISTTFSDETCFTATVDSNTYNIRCRVDPTSNELCLTSSYESARCFRKRQLISYNFYTYSDTASAQPYFAILGFGPCNNQSLETEIERAFYSKYEICTIFIWPTLTFLAPLCDNAQLNQPVDGDQEKINLGLVSCSSGSCSQDILATYTIEKGANLNIKVVNDFAFGIRFTGNQVCFSWQRKTVQYYLDYSPDYDSMCKMECVSVNALNSFIAEYSYSRYSDGTSSSNSFAFVTDSAPGALNSAAFKSQSTTFWAVVAIGLALLS